MNICMPKVIGLMSLHIYGIGIWTGIKNEYIMVCRMLLSIMIKS